MTGLWVLAALVGVPLAVSLAWDWAAGLGDPWRHGPFVRTLLLAGDRPRCPSCGPGSFDHRNRGSVATVLHAEILARTEHLMRRSR